MSGGIKRKIEQTVAGGRRSVIGMFTIALAVIVFGSVWAQAEGANRVGLVITHGNGQTSTQCVEFSENQITGLQVLAKSGLDLEYEVQPAGAAICKLDQEGCDFPPGPCFCQCQGSSCTYWSYWYIDRGAWEYLQQGASNDHVSHGDVRGWIWGAGTTSSASPPPVYTFEQICSSQATETPTKTPTAMPTKTSTSTSISNFSSPAATPTRTPTRVATPTRSPSGSPVISTFKADKTTVSVGEKVKLTWRVSNASKVYLEYVTTREEVAASGSRTVAPNVTTTYSLVAENNKGKVAKKLTIKTSEPTATPTVTGTPAPTLPPKPTPTEMPSPTPTNSPTTTKTPVPSPTASPTRTPTPTPTHTITPTPTYTPSPTITSTPSATLTPRPIAALPTAYIKATPRNGNSTIKVEVSETGLNRIFTLGLISGGLFIIIMTPLVLLAIGIGVWWFARRQ